MSEPTGRLSGVVADRYRIDREVGRGGMATVYLAFDQRRHDSRVALKVLRPELASRLGGDRFVREIRITAQLQHPNILPVFDSGEADGNPFFVMPFIDGETLEQRLQREGPLPVEEAISIVSEVADALAYAHERGFVHRDVKPSNIMLSHGHAQLADFGIARAVDAASGDEQLTETGLAIGTALYMSPEQALGQTVDGRADIYALACVLYEMLAGSPPFTGPPRIIVARHSADTAPSIRVVRDAVPEAVEKAIFKAMAKVPADRFADAVQFRDALRSAVTTQMTAVEPGRSVQRAWVYRALAAAAVTLLVIVLVRVLGPALGGEELDPDRVLMLPLNSTVAEGAAPAGGDIANLILAAMEGSGSLKWEDGRAVLDSASRERGPSSLDEAADAARARRAAHFIMGSIFPAQGGRVIVELTLYRTADSEQIMRAPAPPTPADSVYRSALISASQLLQELIPGSPALDPEWFDRQPRAIASFLRGEAAFRRINLDEAVAHYRTALEQDPGFGLAAIRGAQAAGWAHRSSEAAAMIDAAQRLPLPPRYTDFAAGYAAYLRGNADSAVAGLQRALDADPEMAVAWMQLGEVYTHLLPAAGNPDSLAWFAFEEARRLDPVATNIVHPIEILLRAGNEAAAAPLVQQFLAADPDESWAAPVGIMQACVRDGANRVDWRSEAAERPFDLLKAVKSLSAGAAQYDCAIAGYRALLAVDTSSTDSDASGRTWAALQGLQNLLISAGRVDEAVAAVDAFHERRGLGWTLLMADAIVTDDLIERASAVLEESYRSGPISEWRNIERLSHAGHLEARLGHPDRAEEIADELTRRHHAGGSVRDSLAALSIRAYAALARGLDDEALQRLEALVPAHLPADQLSWDELTPLAPARLALARLLFDRGEYHRALAVADVFDSQAPLNHLLFVGASLDLRVEAAEKLGTPHYIGRYTSRRDALRQARSATN